MPFDPTVEVDPNNLPIHHDFDTGDVYIEANVVVSFITALVEGAEKAGADSLFVSQAKAAVIELALSAFQPDAVDEFVKRDPDE